MDFFDRELGAEWRERLRDPRLLERARARPGRALLGRPRRQVKARMLASVRERLQREYAAQGPEPRAAAPRHALARPAAPGRADARLRAALRHLQARHAAAARPRAPRAPGQRSGAPGAVPVRRQGASGGRAGQAGAARDPPAHDEPEFAGRIVFLEDYDLQLARWLVSGRRCVAQQPDRAARGERHLGHQGRHQRPAQPEHPRWLVGGRAGCRTTAGAFRRPTCRTRSGATRSRRS